MNIVERTMVGNTIKDKRIAKSIRIGNTIKIRKTIKKIKITNISMKTTINIPSRIKALSE